MKRILVANRGEIAVRILRSAHEAGYETVAVYADQDLQALHTELADQSMPLRGTTAAQTYLDIDTLIAAARKSGADAVHPGYGFLSENPDFARAVQGAGLTWIGPDPETIEKLGDKVSARAIALAVGAPLVPGSEGPEESAEEVHAFAAEHGLPVAIKAAHGGGGRGMRVVRSVEDIDDAFTSATREAIAAFGKGECYVERYLDRPRHVEVQVLADRHGTVVALGTRDCSLQRRNQKLVEEAPAPFLSGEVHERLLESARAICAEAGYIGAATVEYLLSPDGTLSFLEVNTRLQVEHPVTEETTGVDIVAEQLRIAEGRELSVRETPESAGHAIEFRINAEDPALGFIPVPGRLEEFRPPTGPGIRIDTGFGNGDAVSGEFDSLIAKLIVNGPDRATTLRRARLALREMRIVGLPSVLPFHRTVLDSADFLAQSGPDSFRVHTRWIETDFAEQLAESEYLAQAVREREGAMRRLTIEIDDRPVRLGVPEGLLGLFGSAADAGAGLRSPGDDQTDERAERTVTSPVSGTLVSWLAEDGDAVEVGDAIAVVEAMKMETKAVSEHSGTFTRSEIEPGSPVSTGEVLGHVEG